MKGSLKSAQKSVTARQNRIGRGGKAKAVVYEKQTDTLAKQVFADGWVSGEEMLQIKQNHELIVQDFLCACDVLEQMEKKQQNYSKERLEVARFVVKQLMGAKEKSDLMMNKATYYNDIPPVEKTRRMERRLHRQPLKIRFNLYEIFALNGNAHDVVHYARKHEMKRLMTPREIQDTEKRIHALIEQIVHTKPDEKQIEQFICNELNQRTR